MSGSSRNNFEFGLRFWLVTLSALVLMTLTFSLGMWQLNRAEQKEQMSSARTKAEVIRLSGQWDAAKTVYVDNRQMNLGGQTKQGFFVVTPLVTSPSEYVLVERGWIPRNFADRKKLASIDTPSGTVSIEARTIADPVPAAAFAKEANLDYPIVQFVDLASLAKAMENRAYKGMAQQIGAANEGLKRDWYEPASGAAKNYGYAFQWFAMCALALGLYIWYQWIKPKMNANL